MNLNDRNHPVRQLLDEAAATGRVPTRDEINALPVADRLSTHECRELRTWISEQATYAAGLRSDGAHGPARRHASASAAQIADQLAEPTAPDLDHLDPRQLASAVRDRTLAEHPPGYTDPRSLGARIANP